MLQPRIPTSSSLSLLSDSLTITSAFSTLAIHSSPSASTPIRTVNSRRAFSHQPHSSLTPSSTLCLRLPGSLGSGPSTTSTTTTFVRYASHAAQGRANGPKDSAGRRLGAKKSASEYVVPGNIIFKQRGTKWHPGENVGIGKDHTIYALVHGYVRYYRNPLLDPKKRYIGVALEREGPASKLPTPPNAPSRRKLGMFAVPMKAEESDTNAAAFLDAHVADGSKPASSVTAAPFSTFKPSGPQPTNPIPVIMREGTFRETNYSIGRTAERKGISVKPFMRKDRWLAWRKRAAKIKVKTDLKKARAQAKKGGSKKKGGKKGVAKKR